MGLFGLGKKEEKRPSRLEFERLPALPEFPSHDEDVPELPHYEPSISELKNEVNREENDIPKRERRIMPVLANTSSSPPSMSSSYHGGDEKPLFIKIDKYKEALRAIDTLKAKIIEAEKVLKSLEDIREEENATLDTWKSELQSLKDKLLTIDQNLFEA